MITKVKPLTPLYSTLSNLACVLDATGLRWGQNNSYGEVNNSGHVISWKGIAPGTTTDRLFSGSGFGTPLKLIDGGINFGGQSTIFHDGTITEFNFLHYNSPVSNLKWTMHIVGKIGNNSDPDYVYGIIGNNGTSQGNKGIAEYFEDRVIVSRTDGLTSLITKGTAGFIISGTPNSIITPNTPLVLTIETDMSLTAADRQKYYINGVRIAHTVSSPSTAVATNPTYALNIGSTGNNIFPLFGWISHVVIQSGVESGGTMTAFVNSLLPYTVRKANQFLIVDEARTYQAFNTYAPAGRYFFVQGMTYNPLNPAVIMKLYHNGNAHTEDNDKYIAFQKSTDYGRTWGSNTTWYDDDGAGTYAVQDGQADYTSDGRLHSISCWHTTIGTGGGSHKLIYTYSDDDGTTVNSVDISSVIPSDGLNSYRAHGKIVEGGDGYVYACLYKFTDEGDVTQSANYVLRKPVGSSTTWTVFTVRAVGSTYINEMSIERVDNSTLIIIARDEATKEWNQYLGTSNGSSWSDQGAVTFGETRTTVASPPFLTSFNIVVDGISTRVLACWFLDKESATKTVEYICALPANILSSGVSGWNTSTKSTAYSSSTNILHYLKVAFPYGNINGVGAGALEPNPFTGTENSLVTFDAAASNYYPIRTALGL